MHTKTRHKPKTKNHTMTPQKKAKEDITAYKKGESGHKITAQKPKTYLRQT